jgi:NTE family protein
MGNTKKKMANPKPDADAGFIKRHKAPFECIALLLQGGGALGAYQAGVYQALSEAGLEPDWVAGISIGAINAAIIAGNAPDQRVSKLRQFWELITQDPFQYYPAQIKSLITRNETQYQLLNLMSTINTIISGIPGFFKPRPVTPWLELPGTVAATSFYDFTSLKATLEQLIDFDRLNNDDIRFSIGAVNVKSGNFTDFDNKTHRITAEHVMASSALPPGFSAVEIGGEYFWDGGLISNTPLEWVLESISYFDTLIFQVDLWSADGNFPQNMADVLTRQKDIQFSSRTRANTDRFREQHQLRYTISSLLEKLPDNLQQLDEVKLLSARADRKVYNIVHLIYHNKFYEGYSKDFEFSRLSMEAHWESGYNDTVKTLGHPEVLERPDKRIGIAVFDFSREKASKTASAYRLKSKIDKQ